MSRPKQQKSVASFAPGFAWGSGYRPLNRIGFRPWPPLLGGSSRNSASIPLTIFRLGEIERISLAAARASSSSLAQGLNSYWVSQRIRWFLLAVLLPDLATFHSS